MGPIHFINFLLSGISSNIHNYTRTHTAGHRQLYCIVSINLYSAYCRAHQSEALPVRETQREERSLKRTKRRTWHTSCYSLEANRNNVNTTLRKLILWFFIVVISSLFTKFFVKPAMTVL